MRMLMERKEMKEVLEVQRTNRDVIETGDSSVVAVAGGTSKEETTRLVELFSLYLTFIIITKF